MKVNINIAAQNPSWIQYLTPKFENKEDCRAEINGYFICKFANPVELATEI